MQELIPLFDLSRLNTNSTRLDFERVGEINRETLRRDMTDPHSCQQHVQYLRQLVQQNFQSKDQADGVEMSDQHLQVVYLLSVYLFHKVSI